MAATLQRVPLAFDRARDRFLQTLTTDEKDKCFGQSTSIDDIYTLAEQLQREQGLRGSLQNMARIEPFINGMAQYAKVIEVFIQVKPEIMALIWGPFKLLLQLASQYNESFEKVLDAIGQIGENLPRFQRYVVAFSYSNHMQEVISNIYEDIMDFYRHALQFFSRRGKTKSSPWRILFNLAWTSFETQFGLILRNLQRHQALVDAEACAEDIIQSQRAREEELKRVKEHELEDIQRKIKEIRDWLKPVNTVDLREHCGRLKQYGTGNWLIQNKIIKAWIGGKLGGNSVWLTGKPGSGKTILSHTVLEYLEGMVTFQNSNCGLVLYFFCSYQQQDLMICQNILCTLIYQIIMHKKDLLAYVYPEIMNSLSVRMLQNLLYDLIEASVSPSEFVYVIIDGIDELPSKEREIILRTLTELRKNKAGLASKIFVASRDLMDIRSAFEKPKAHKISEIAIKESNQSDIHQYIVSESQRVVEEIIREGGFEQRVLQKEIERSLWTRADGMFLWVHLVIESLLSQDSIKEIREALVDLPEGLSQVYERIIDKIRRLDERQRSKANKTLEWMTCTYRPLKIAELEDALSMESHDSALDKEKRLSVIRLRRLCGPIIEISNNGTVIFVHFTAKEYLLDQRSGPFINPLNSHFNISLVCLTYQCFRCFESRISNDEAVRFLLNGDLRLFDYVHSNWFKHTQGFCRHNPNQNQIDILAKSLERLFWERASPTAQSQNVGPNHEIDEFNCFGSILKIKLTKISKFREELEKQKLSLGPGIDLSRWSDLNNPLTFMLGARRLQSILEKFILNERPPDPFKIETVRSAYGENLYFCKHSFCQNSSSGGFPTELKRMHHEQTFHAQTHKCPVQHCTFADRAFASEAALRTHTMRYHFVPPKKTYVTDTKILEELFIEMKDRDEGQNAGLGYIPNTESLQRQVAPAQTAQATQVEETMYWMQTRIQLLTQELEHPETTPERRNELMAQIEEKTHDLQAVQERDIWL